MNTESFKGINFLIHSFFVASFEAALPETLTVFKDVCQFSSPTFSSIAQMCGEWLSRSVFNMYIVPGCENV